MTEEEIIDILENVFIFKNTSDKFTDLDLNAINGLLDLYNKQKEEIERLKNAEEYAKLGKETLLDAIHKQKEEIKSIEDRYISKDKIRELLPKINGSINHFKSKNDNHIVKRIKRMLEELLKE